MQILDSLCEIKDTRIVRGSALGLDLAVFRYFLRKVKLIWLPCSVRLRLDLDRKADFHGPITW